MFALLELVNFFFVAVCAGFRSGNVHFSYIVSIFVLIAVAGRAADLIIAVFAQLPIRNDIRGCVLMTVDTLLSEDK